MNSTLRQMTVHLQMREKQAFSSTRDSWRSHLPMPWLVAILPIITASLFTHPGECYLLPGHSIPNLNVFPVRRRSGCQSSLALAGGSASHFSWPLSSASHSHRPYLQLDQQILHSRSVAIP